MTSLPIHRCQENPIAADHHDATATADDHKDHGTTGSRPESVACGSSLHRSSVATLARPS